MARVEGSWQDISTSSVLASTSGTASGHGHAHARSQDGQAGRLVQQRQDERRHGRIGLDDVASRYPSNSDSRQTASSSRIPLASGSTFETADLSGGSWTSLGSVDTDEHLRRQHSGPTRDDIGDTSIESTSSLQDVHLPGAYGASSSATGRSSMYPLQDQTSRSTRQIHTDDDEDPFSIQELPLPGSALMPRERDSNPPSSASSSASAASEARGESQSATPRKTYPSSSNKTPRQYAVRSPRSAGRQGVYSPSSAAAAKAGYRSGRAGGYASPSGLRRRKGSSVVDDDDDLVDDQRLATPRRKAKRKGNDSPSWIRMAGDIVSVTYQIVTLPLAPIVKMVSKPVQDATKWLLVLVGLILLARFFIWPSVTSLLGSAISSATFGLLGPSSALLSGAISSSPLFGVFRIVSPTYWRDAYCDTVGFGCTGEKEEVQLGKLAKQIGAQALQAHDMFTSVVAVGDPSSLALNHAEIWELAVAVQVSSEMENKDFLGKQLYFFGNQVRDVKDTMSVLHSRGITAFQWALHRFSRLEKTIELMQSKPGTYTIDRLSRQLDELFSHLDGSLEELLSGIENAIPLTAQASDSAGYVRAEFGSEQTRMQRAREDKPFWRRLQDLSSYKGRQLAKDIQMTTDTVESIKDLRFNLESTRSFLLSYRDQVAYFRGGFKGFHLGDHGLDPEDEVDSLRIIMQRFEESVEKARYASSPEGLRESAMSKGRLPAE